MSSPLRTILRGSFTVFVMNMAAAVLGFLLRIMLARSLSVEDFGLFYALLAFLMPIGVLKNFGFNKAMTKYLPEYRGAGDLEGMKESLLFALIVSFITSFTVALVIWMISGWLGGVFFRSPLAGEGLRIMLFYFAVSTMGAVITAFFQGMKKPLLLSFRSVFTALVICAAVFFLHNLTINRLCLIHVGAETAALIFAVFFLYRLFPFFTVRTRLSLTGFKKLLSFGSKAISAHLVNRVFGRLDILMLTYFKTLGQVGFYSAAQPFSRLFIIFGSSIGTMMFPYSSEMFASKQEQELRETVGNLQRGLLFILAPIAVVCFLFSSQLLNLLFGRAYEAGSLVVRFLVIGSVIHALTVINTSVLIGIGHPLKVTKMMGIQSFINLGGNILLIPTLGANGAALSTLIAYWCMFLTSSYYVRGLIGHAFHWGGFVKVCAGGFLMILVLKGGEIFLSGGIAVLAGIIFPSSLITYIVFSIFSGLIRREEMIRLVNRLKSSSPGRFITNHPKGGDDPNV